MKKFIFLFFLATTLYACQQQSSKQPGPDGSFNIVLSVPEYQDLIARGGIQLVDVRTPQEFAEGHIDGAVNINVEDEKFQNVVQSTLKKDQPVAVYCRTGSRSEMAREMLVKMGYNQLYDLKGGYLAWPK